jgi:hypothetical protein
MAFPKQVAAVVAAALHTFHATAAEVTLTRADYQDRVHAMWVGQIIATLVGFPFEHQTASVHWVDKFPKPYSAAPVDDDWYYEMAAVRGLEKYGIGMTVEQLGQQWLENNCGTWGSSEQARLNMQKGIEPPDCGHPRYNRLWFSIGPQFSADVYGALAPGMPNLAGRIAREYGRINGFAEGVDGAVFVAGMISLGFVETDPKTIVRKAAQLIHPSSPYRQCLDELISNAGAGKSFQEVVDAVEDRWHMEYPATNNAVANGGIVAAGVWFGEGDFWKTVNLICGAADFTDADCNAANAAAVIGAMHGMKAMPADLVAQLNDRIAGDNLGGLKTTPPVDEKISDLAARTAAIGEKFLAANGAAISGGTLRFTPQEPVTQAAEKFRLADLMQYWNPEWKLERAGFGGAGGGMTGIRGITFLDGDVLATYPRDEVRATLLSRRLKLSAEPRLTFQAGSIPGRAWELNVYANNQRLVQQIIDAPTPGQVNWHPIDVDLSAFAGQDVTLRLYQRVFVPRRTAGNAYWKELKVE